MLSAALVYTAAVCSLIGQTPSPSVAVVNLADLFERYTMVRDLEALFDEKRDAVAGEGQKKRDDINLQRNALAQFKPGTPDFQEREEALVRAEIEFQVWLEVQERRLKDNHKRWLLSIYEQVQDAVAKIAAQRGYDVVLTYNDLDPNAPDSMSLKQQILLRSVLFASHRSDMTDAVVERLEHAYEQRGGRASLQQGPQSSGSAAPPGQP